MKEIPLTRGMVALVDDEDYERVSAYKWQAMAGSPNKDVWYASRGALNRCLLHRFIVNAPDDIDVDHHNGNGLDNQKRNLRLATASQNGANRKPNRGRRFKGVHYHQVARRWRAVLKCQGGVGTYLGQFHTPEDAARAYDAKAIEMFGEFARPNFPDKRAA